MTTDKTGAQVTVSPEHQKYTIAVDGKTVGFAEFADRGDQRVFYHTEIDPDFGGRGLATILVKEALERRARRRKAHRSGVFHGRHGAQEAPRIRRHHRPRHRRGRGLGADSAELSA